MFGEQSVSAISSCASADDRDLIPTLISPFKLVRSDPGKWVQSNAPSISSASLPPAPRTAIQLAERLAGRQTNDVQIEGMHGAPAALKLPYRVGDVSRSRR